MGLTKDQIEFYEKYETQLQELLEEEISAKRREKNERKIHHVSFIIATIFVVLGSFLYNLFKCKIVFADFNVIYFLIETSFELAIWGFSFAFTSFILIKTKYKMYGYFISTIVSFILSYIFIGLFDFKLSDRISKYSIISAISSALLFIFCYIYGINKGSKAAKTKNYELLKMEKEYYDLFMLPRHYDNKPSRNEIKKNSRKKNRKK